MFLVFFDAVVLDGDFNVKILQFKPPAIVVFALLEDNGVVNQVAQRFHQCKYV